MTTQSIQPSLNVQPVVSLSLGYETKDLEVDYKEINVPKEAMYLTISPFNLIS